ncbi:hypothetical protein BDD12DRAFT_822155 [Trichophaea hybrida]|nr:hypothetical protein BDD12DRAFT_822155 [Trichophaea hybrida]
MCPNLIDRYSILSVPLPIPYLPCHAKRIRIDILTTVPNKQHRHRKNTICNTIQ